MHPALFPFSQPKTSHQSSKLHPDPDCAVLCRCPMWPSFPSLFRNNWSCHRHSDAAARYHTLEQHLLVRNSVTATTSTLLDNRCWISFTGPLQPFPPRTLPKLCGRNPGFPNKTTVCRSLMLVVIPGDVGLFEVPQAADDEDDEDDEGSSVTGVVGKKRPSGVLCCCVIGFVFFTRNLWGWNFDQYNRTKRMMATKREVDHKIVFSLVVSSCYANGERDLK